MKYYNNTTWNDKWIVDLFNRRRNGYFVEIGAADGIGGSQTKTLAESFGWTGLLIEANPRYFLRGRHNLVRNRPESECLHRAIGEPGAHTFFSYPPPHAGYSGFPAFNTEGASAWIDRRRKQGLPKPLKLSIQCRKLETVLNAVNVPEYVDFLAIDAEKSESAILGKFNFKRYKFGAIALEAPPPSLVKYLKSVGYQEATNPFCECTWERYFVAVDS